MLVLYLAILLTALYWAAKNLLPELLNAPSPKVAAPPRSVVSSSGNPDEGRVNKLETLLAEKSKNIQLLQNELKILLSQVRDFDKVKTLLDEEILHLREQNRIFRSELGLPKAQPQEQPKESSIT